MATPTHSTVRIKVEDRGGALADQIANRQPELSYRSTNFFDETNSFESAADFFEQARIRLLKDCGYEAKPSKNKSNKASVRCEQHAATGCPFRLCAFVDSSRKLAPWRVSVTNSTWSHSHKPKPTPTIAAAAVPSQTSVPAKRPRDIDSSSLSSAASRTVVLYDKTSRFSSIEDFYSQTRTLSLEKYDVSCTPHYSTWEGAVSSCGLRQACRCPYRIRAKRSGSMFKIDLKGTVWEHNHERGKRDAVAPGLPTRGRTSQRERSNGDSAPEDEIASEGEEEGDVVEAESDQPAEATKSDLAIVPPAAPKVGDQFKNLDEGYAAFAIANITQLGVSVFRSGSGESLHGSLYCNRRASRQGCPFKAVFGPVGRRCAVLPTSVLHHSHDTHPNLLADPTWRPPIRCKIVRAAFANLYRQVSQSMAVDSKPELVVPSPPAVPKRPRLSEPTAPASSWTIQPAVDSPAPAPRSSLPPHMSSNLGGGLPRTQTGASTSSPIISHSQVKIATASFDSSRATSLLSSTSSLNVKSRTGSEGTSLPPEQPKPAPLPARADSDVVVTSFLAGLDVALVPLASHLVDAGIDSLDSLTALACLSADVRRALLTTLHGQVAARDPQCPSPLRLLSLFPH